MHDDKPAWRVLFDAWEGTLRDTSEQWANSEEFSALLMSLGSNWQSLNAKTKDQLTKVMHLANVPSYTDIAKLHRQVGSLTGKVDDMSARMEELEDAMTRITEQLDALVASSVNSKVKKGD